MAQTSGPARFFFLRSPIRAGRVPPFFLTRKPRIPSPPLYKHPSPLSPAPVFFCICSCRRHWPPPFSPPGRCLCSLRAATPCTVQVCLLRRLPPGAQAAGHCPLRRPPPGLCMQRPPAAAASSAICTCRPVLCLQEPATSLLFLRCYVAAAVSSGLDSHHHDTSLPWVSGKTVSVFVRFVELVLFKRKLSFSSAFIS